MDARDRQAIDGLFARLDDVERRSGPRDAEAEALIRERIGRQPAAPYLMAQTIVVQEQALNDAQQRLAELEDQLARRPSGGGLFGGLFGGGQPAPRRPLPGSAPGFGRPGAVPQVPMQGGPWQGQQGMHPQGRGGGFLAGAAQTAMGVAGGMLLGNAIAGMFGGNDAHASEPPPAEHDSGADSFGDEEF